MLNLKEILENKTDEELFKIGENVGIKNTTQIPRKDLIYILADVFESEEEFNRITQGNTDIKNRLNNYNTNQLRGIYYKVFSDVKKTDIKNYRKSKLVDDLQIIDSIEEILNDFDDNNSEEVKEERINLKDNIIYYVKKLQRNHKRLLCKNLGIEGYKHWKVNELENAIFQKIIDLNYDLKTIESILKKGHEEVKEAEIVYEEYNIDIGIPEIKYIIHIADLHIRRNHRIEEYQEVFDNFYNQLKTDYERLKDKTVVICCGDIFHYKTTQRAEGLRLWNKLVKNITSLFPFICILGNHDVDLTSSDTDWIRPLDGIIDNFYYFKNTGLYNCSNVVFGVSSLIEGNILPMKKLDNTKKYIQLYHGTVNGCSIFNGGSLSSPYMIEDFGYFDLLLLGDIHKFQYLNKEKTVCYPGSMIQQNKGESVFNHGYVEWNLEDNKSVFHEVDNPNCFLKVNIEGNTVDYDTRILDKKKYLNITYVIKEECKYDDMIINFEKNITDSGLIITKTEYDINAEIEENIDNLFTKENIQEKNIEKYIEERLESEAHDNERIKKILDIHRELCKEEVYEETSRSKWFLKEISFKNVFSYGNDIVNKVVFDRNGFYKIFGPNYLGKSSVINMIKWLFFGETSGINDCDVVHKGLTGSDTSFIHCEFIIGNKKYNLKKDMSKSSKKCGFTVGATINIYEDNLIKESIEGEKNVSDFLDLVIGDYKQFELIASINNTELGILKEKKTLTIFNQLFKLDRFINFETLTKDKIKKINTEIKMLNNDLKKYNEDYTLKVENLEKEKQERVDNINNITFHDEKEIELLDNEVMTKQKTLSQIILKEEVKTEDVSKELKSLKKEYKKLKEEYDIKEISELDDLIKSTEEKIEKYSKEIKNLSRQILPLKDIDIKSIESLHSKMKEKESSVSDKINKIESEISEIKTEIDNKSSEIINVSFDEDEIKEKISKQDYDYQKEKKTMVEKLSSKSKILAADRSLLIKLLTDQDYQSFLDIINKNNLLREEIQVLDNQKESVMATLNKKKSILKQIEKKLYSYESEMKEYEKNKKQMKVNQELNEKISVLENDINESREYLSKINMASKKLLNIRGDLKILVIKDKKYQGYIDALEYNKIYREEYNRLSLEISDLNIKLNNLKTENMNMKIHKRELEVEIKSISDKINSYKEKNSEYSDLVSQIITKEQMVHNLNIYKSLVNEKGIPSLILEDKIPQIQDEINKILKYYTNFQIKIVMNGLGIRKKIDIYQIKNNNEDLELTINSCSGYEIFILNIAFKLAIKKFCYVNYPSFICIDEVWEKISEENYSKLHKIFDILRDNYKNIIIISHIEQIKHYLEENYDGKYINIAKNQDKNYSYLL